MVRIMMEQVRLCKNCDSKVIGRKDRKYCSSNCRKRYSVTPMLYYSVFLKNRDRIIENEIGSVILDGVPVSEGYCLFVLKQGYAL